MSAPDDASLARAARAGDPVSLGVLLERHRALLHGVAVGMLGHGPLAEDAVHDTFLLAMRGIGELRDPAAARAWLLAILSNVCRAELRRPALELVADLPEPPATAATAPVEEAMERTALRDWVWAALARLSEPLRVVVVLRYFTNANSYEAIANLCGVPVGTVRSRLNAARAKLANELMETAALAHADVDVHRRRALELSTAMRAFERTADPAPLRSVFATDVRFTLADRVEHRGVDLFAALLAADFEDGVTTRPIRILGGADLTVVEVWLDSPPEQPLHCPPALTQVHFHDGHVTRRIASHYAHRPSRLRLAGAHARRDDSHPSGQSRQPPREDVSELS
jgi:RNA polymerase sigma factor (sigma-70 family)